MRTVTTKKELADAINKGEKVKVVGPLAEELYKKKKVKTATKVVGLLAIAASVAALPFTGGASVAGIAAGAALTIGTVTMTTAELAIILGFCSDMLKEAMKNKITYKKYADGSYEAVLEPTK